MFIIIKVVAADDSSYSRLENFEEYLLERNKTDKVDQTQADTPEHQENQPEISQQNNLPGLSQQDLDNYLDQEFSKLFGNDYRAIVQDFKESSLNLVPALLLEENKLKTRIDDFIHARKNYYFHKFQEKLFSWFPQLWKQISDFPFFIWDIDSNGEILKNLSSTKSEFLSIDNVYLQRYAAEKKVEFDSKIYEIIEKIILKNINSATVIMNMRKLKSEHIEESFTPQMLFVTSFLENLVKSKLDNSFACVKNLQSKLDEILASQNLTDGIIRKNCVAKEICSRNIHAEAYQEEFNKYILGFKEKFNDKRFDLNVNIKDEIDESIYDVIRKLLKTKPWSSEKSDCIVDFLIRTREIDKIYTPDLLFDEVKLRKIIEPMLSEYSREFRLVN